MGKNRIEQEQTLKTQLTYWVECYKDVAERNALAETPKESAEYLISLILAEVDKVENPFNPDDHNDLPKVSAYVGFENCRNAVKNRLGVVK